MTHYPTYHRKERIETENARTLALGLLFILMMVIGIGAIVGW